MVRLAGPAADAGQLAAWFNGLAFLSCLALLLSSGWLLHELGGSRVAIHLLVFALWLWPGWGEFTAGYYTLLAYVQVQALAAASVAAVLRARASPAWFAGSFAFAGLAMALNISGVLAATASLVANLAIHRRDGRGHRLHRLGLLALLLAFVVVYLLVAQREPTERERVQNPVGTMLGTSIAERLRDAGAAALPAVLAGPGGTALNLGLPTFLQRGVETGSLPPRWRWSLFGLELALTVGLFALAARQWGRLAPQDRRLSLALAATAAAALAMVIVARAHYASTVPVSLWHAKYLLMPTCWLCLASFFVLDRRRDIAPLASSGIGPVAFALAVAGPWFAVSIQQAEKALLPMTITYSARGRWGNVENAKTRRTEHARLMKELENLRAAEDAREVLLPTPESWQDEFFRQFPSLEWATDFTPRGVTHLFADMPAAAPRYGLRVRWQPVAALTDEQRTRLRSVSWLKPALTTTE